MVCRRAYPRWRGGNIPGMRATASGSGLSPLARGKHDFSGTNILSTGPIPAGAGETWPPLPLPGRRWAYPRWRGGNAAVDEGVEVAAGLSPLARGKLGLAVVRETFAGPIPAGAGETFDGVAVEPAHGAYPRWRGGNVDLAVAGGGEEGLSPLARGKRSSI